MRSSLICLAALGGIVLSTPAGAETTPTTPAGAETTPSCTDKLQPKPVDNPKLSIVPDPKTTWEPRGGTASFTIRGNNVSLDGVKVIVCFGWPMDNWRETKFPWEGRVTLTKFDTTSATYGVIVPELDSAHVSWADRAALWIVPLAAMRIIAYGGVAATPAVDVQPFIGITSPRLALLLAALAVAISFAVFYFFARNRGVPGKGLLLWMISTRNGVASLSQAQIVLWTFLIGASSIYVMALSGVLIDVTDSTLVLLGITGVATLASKLQNSQQDGKSAAQVDNKALVPGKVLNVLQVGIATDSEVRLAWSPPTDGGPVAGYVVQYQQKQVAGAPANPIWNTVSETIILPHHTVLALAAGKEYTFQVRAVNSAGQMGDPETIGPIETQPRWVSPEGAPELTGGLRVAGSPTMTGVNLAWSPATGAPTAYSAEYRRHDSVQTWTAVPQPPVQAECTVDGLISGVAYDFRVAAVNASGQGLWSTVVTARTLREPQWADLVVTGDGRGEIDVTRVQMLFFTLVAALFVGMKVLTSYVIPDIPQGILLLMGISNGVYLTAKFIPD